MVKQSAVAADQTLPNSATHITKTYNYTELSQILTATRGLHQNVQKLHINYQFPSLSAVELYNLLNFQLFWQPVSHAVLSTCAE